MKLSLNTYILSNRIGIEKTLVLFAQTGFDAADIDFFDFDSPESGWQVKGIEGYAAYLLQTARACGLTFNQAHSPFRYDWDDPDVIEKSIIPTVERCLYACSLMEVDKLVVHPLSHPAVREPREKRMEANIRFYRSLAPFAKQYGVKIALENLRYVCTTPDEYVELMDTLDDSCFVACVDLGHAAVAGDDGSIIRRLGHDRVKLIHAHDNWLESDKHMIPGTGLVNWENMIQALAEIRYDGDFTLELLDYVNGFWKQENGFADDFIPVALRIAFECGRYLANQLERRMA